MCFGSQKQRPVNWKEYQPLPVFFDNFSFDMQTGQWAAGNKQPRRDQAMDQELIRRKEEQATLQKELIDRKHKKMLLEQYIIKQDKELEGRTGWIRGEYEKYRGRENEILPSRVIEKHLSPIKIITYFFIIVLYHCYPHFGQFDDMIN